MTVAGYLILGWGVSLATMALYAATLIRRGRDGSARVPQEAQRWLTTK